jgi:hypothetical protein
VRALFHDYWKFDIHIGLSRIAGAIFGSGLVSQYDTHAGFAFSSSFPSAFYANAVGSIAICVIHSH